MRDCNICITVSYLSASQGRASETTWIVATITCSLMEMGTYIYGFRGWIAKVATRSRCNMGYCGSTYQDGAFRCVQHDVFSRTFKSFIHSAHCMFAWCFYHHCVRSRFTFYRRILEEFAGIFGNIIELEFSLSSTDGRPDRAS